MSSSPDTNDSQRTKVHILESGLLMPVPALISDVDGTVAIRNGREPFEWSRLHEDLPNEGVIEVISRLAQSGLQIIFISGREERYRSDTESWLNRHVHFQFELYCRNNEDYRKDSVIKQEIYLESIHERFKVLAVLDDRDQVVRMWRDVLGLTCLQVNWGDF